MIAIISDIHGNLWGLEAVLADIDRRGPKQVVVAGDLAFGGPRPAECVALIRRRGYPTIRGNTDEWLTRAPARVTDATTWASAQLSEADRRFLAGLPFLWRLPHDAGDLVVVHATPWSVQDVVWPDAPADLINRVFTEAGARTVAYGHIHIAYTRELDGRLLVNPGSAGLPFDGDRRAAYGVLSVQGGNWQAEVRRVEYDLTPALAAARANDNPGAAQWAHRLENASAR